MLTAIDRWDAWPDIEMIRTQTSADYTPIDAAQLGTVARLMNDPTLAALLRLTPPEVGTITLTGDIDLSEKLWTPISELKTEGVLDGQNHSITGLYGGSAGYGNYGLVKTNRGTIKDLTINEAGVTAGTIAGTVAGTNAGTITNVSVSGAELTTTGKAGGVVGVSVEKEEEPETYEIPASVGDASVALTAEIEEGVATIVEAELDPVLDAKETGAVTFDVCALEEEIVSIVIPADVIRQLADAAADETNGVNGLEVQMPDGSVKLDAEALAEAAESDADIAVALEQFDDDSFSVQVLANGKPIETPVKVELTDVPEGQVLALVAADGSVTPIKKSLIDGGKAYALVESGTTVKAIDAALAFPDVPESKWYKSAVDFVSSHGLFQGTNNGFEPGLYMNRAMLATVLYRLEDAAEGTNPFNDIAEGTWYTDAVIWASENGIVNGTGTGFQPMRNVTREQIATMLFRYAKYLGLDTGASSALDAFPDGSETADWAREAMQWAVSVGLFQGNADGSLNPKGDATRAEVAALMQRMVGLIVK